MTSDRLRLVTSQAREDDNTASAIIEVRGHFRLVARLLLHMLRYVDGHGGITLTIQSKGGR